MALFKKEQTDKKETAPVKKAVSVSSKEAISSIISQEMNITGELTFTGKARLDGTLEGNLNGDYLILSETGRIEGDLQLNSLICHGKIEGNIRAKVVTIHSTAAIKGKLVAASLTVEPGALLSGEISAAYQEEQAISQKKQAAKPTEATEGTDKENKKS